MRYGDVSPDFRERFVPGAFGQVSTIPVNLQHDPSIVIAPRAALADTKRELRVRAELPVGSAALDLVRRGALNGFSIEFTSQSERRESGVRVVERAKLTGLALVDQGAYPGARAEVRARSGRTMRASIPSKRRAACECLGKDACGVRFPDDVLEEGLDEAFGRAGRGEGDLIAVAGDFSRGWRPSLEERSGATVRRSRSTCRTPKVPGRCWRLMTRPEPSCGR